MVWKKYTKKDYEEYQQEIKETIKQLEEGIKDVFSSSKYKEYLITMSKFHSYSNANILWIQNQNPNATLIAGTKKWNELGRRINKGEKALRVLAPMVHKEIKELEKIDPNTQKPVLDANGKVVMEKKQIEWLTFKTVPVFDVRQTNGKELPSIVEELKTNIDGFNIIKEAIERSAKVPIKFQKIEDGAKGYYSPSLNYIAIKEGMSDSQTVKTLLHEIVHSRLHNKNEKCKERNQQEVEAESSAFVIAQHFGIDTSEYSFGYVGSWSMGKELKELKESMGTIRKVSHKLIQEIEEEINLILDRNKENEINDKENEINNKQNEQKQINAILESEDIVLKVHLCESNILNEGIIGIKEASKKYVSANEMILKRKEEAKEKGEYYPYSKLKADIICKDARELLRVDIGDGTASTLPEYILKEICNNHIKEAARTYIEKEKNTRNKNKVLDILSNNDYAIKITWDKEGKDSYAFISPQQLDQILAKCSKGIKPFKLEIFSKENINSPVRIDKVEQDTFNSIYNGDLNEILKKEELAVEIKSDEKRLLIGLKEANKLFLKELKEIDHKDKSYFIYKKNGLALEFKYNANDFKVRNLKELCRKFDKNNVIKKELETYKRKSKER